MRYTIPSAVKLQDGRVGILKNVWHNGVCLMANVELVENDEVITVELSKLEEM